MNIRAEDQLLDDIGEANFLRYMISERDKLSSELAASREREKRLREALKLSREALDHDVPESCWSTGPMTGDSIQDYVVCPGCRAIEAIEIALAETERK